MDWSVIFPIFVAIIVAPLIITGTTALLGLEAKDTLVNEWGERGQLYVAGLGTILHELGHYLMAKFFHHKISGVRLIRIRHFDAINSLGYVNHYTSPYSFYQNLGNFFIGIAPYFSCTGFLFLIHYLLIGTSYNFYVQSENFQNVSTVGDLVTNCLSNLGNSLHDDINNPKMSLVFVLLVFTVSLTGYSISTADWENTLDGLKYYLLVASILAIAVIIACYFSSMITAYVWAFTAFLIFMTVESWLYVLFSMTIVMLVRYIIDRNYRPRIYKPNFNWSSIKSHIFH